ncbi:MAG TPA: MFS transporter [Verrucomicrobiae bacterium]|nr:MFS transporter [Verrucomicrobiae bacterium]
MQNSSPPSRWYLRAFSTRNYRLYFTGLVFSFTGTWMQNVAMSWLAYRLTGSALMLGVIGFISQLPAFVLAPLAGVVADRCDRKSFVIRTQSLALAQALVLTVLCLGDWIRAWHLGALGFFLGVVTAFDIPARHAFVHEITGSDDLPNAIALNSSAVNAARLLGPAVAGGVIALVGEGWCFLINAVSFAGIIAALSLITVERRKGTGESRPVAHEMAEGVSYLARTPAIRDALLLLAGTSLCGMSYTTLLPVFAREVLHDGAQMLGLLTSAAGVGALCGTLYLASRRSVSGLGVLVAAAAATLATALAALSFADTAAAALPVVAVAGFGTMVQIAGTNTIIQTVTDERMRGRVMSFFSMAVVGMTPFGSLLAGSLAQAIGAGHTVLLGSSFCMGGALLFALRLPRLEREVRDACAQRGMIRTSQEG